MCLSWEQRKMVYSLGLRDNLFSSSLPHPPQESSLKTLEGFLVEGLAVGLALRSFVPCCCWVLHPSCVEMRALLEACFSSPLPTCASPQTHVSRRVCTQFPFVLSGPFVSQSIHSLNRSGSWPWTNNEVCSAGFRLCNCISAATNNWVLQRGPQEEPELRTQLFSHSDPGKHSPLGSWGEEFLLHFISCLWSGCLYFPRTYVNSFSNVGVYARGLSCAGGSGEEKENRVCSVLYYTLRFTGSCSTKCSQASLQAAPCLWYPSLHCDAHPQGLGQILTFSET